MSRGPGRVQRAIIAAFEAEPDNVFTVAELAGLAFGPQLIEKRHTDAVDRAVRSLADALELRVCRASRPNHLGWWNVWGKRSKKMPLRPPVSS